MIEELIDKIIDLAWEIRGDWSDPRAKCREIEDVCVELKKAIKDGE